MGAFAEQLKAAQGGRGSTNDVIVDDKKLQSLLLKLNSKEVDTATRRTPEIDTQGAEDEGEGNQQAQVPDLEDDAERREGFLSP